MMFYSFTKALQKGYISKRKYSHVPQMIYNGIQNHLFRVGNDGDPNLTGCCKVAGLGGKPYRDGSYEYYMSEPIRDNDPKAIGPFIMACIMNDI
jgi:unsaturated rhamnogalacturonyl hydrolase